jgi:hypothetical protein
MTAKPKATVALLIASYFPLVIEAFGCQLGTAFGPI